MRPDWALKAVTDIDQYRPNDEIAIMWLGRAVIVFYNGTRSDFRLTDEQWTPGYFAGIGLDVGHSFEEVEVGYFGPLEWREYGDSFKAQSLTMWNLSPSKTLVVDKGCSIRSCFSCSKRYFSRWWRFKTTDARG